MNIITYNVNGLRSALSKGLLDWVRAAQPDVLCLQEIKAGREPLDVSGFAELGYQAYLHAAQKPGYSGVATFTKRPPRAVVEGCGTDCYDLEGRVLRLDFEHVSVLNTYMPSGTSGPERQAFKVQWLHFFRDYVRQLRAAGGPPLLIGGDFNCCQTDIDLHNPKANQNSPGFTPEERQWFRDFLQDGFVDTFRHHHGEAAGHYSWWTYRAGARKRNVGWRLDHLLVEERLRPHIREAHLLPDIVHSDHCPAQVILEF
ncbi:exodeoxyribonuclease III [Hymenobacter weizhouensis]|uniref:exodeoxyribonuclease III n=1 Tax=Hymenobacter sp. YIM 151500-1 TaxID=2987689 RepID=UPI002226E120|nr:exodeoxyribonuclease III [Hymenobacter sp. YIM 151500-1]UYZ62364.1 exodeoxyribonuclease III [Hymenobacter sp. YIM 151500-1]